MTLALRSELLYWVPRVHDNKDLRLAMCDRELILLNEEILALWKLTYTLSRFKVETFETTPAQ